MTRISLALAFILATVSSALALNQSAVPQKFQIPWGQSAGVPYITFPVPQPSQIGIVNCRASLTDGFPPNTMTPGSGCGPFGQDMNGILKQITLWSQWAGAGASVAYDPTFQSAIAGYPRGAVITQAANAGCFWISTADGNAANPDTAGSSNGWTGACPGGGFAFSSSASGNNITITATPFSLTPATEINFISPISNTGAVNLTVNSGTAALQKVCGASLCSLQGGEIFANLPVKAQWSPTAAAWILISRLSAADLNVNDQTLNGGANVNSLNIVVAGNALTIDCGSRNQQWFSNTGTVAISPPANDGNCVVQMENGAGAQIPTFPGFRVGANVGDPLTATNGSVFWIQIIRIHGITSYVGKALQ